MHRRVGSILALALVLATAGCSDSESGSGGPAPLAATDVAFCDAWNTAVASGDDSAADALLDEVPANLEDAAAIIRQAEADGTDSPDADAAAAEILGWTELNCRQGEAGESERRIAPPLDAELAGLSFCGTTAFPRLPDDDRSGMVLYGDAGAEDPYGGPMLGLLWNPPDESDHRGDGDSEPVTVRGGSGVVAPITVFQQTILPELGTVVAWTEGDRAVGLYGRGWPIDRAGELVAIADRLEEVDAGFRIPDGALPAGYAQVFTGSPSVTSLVFAPAPLYSLRYQGDGGLLDLNGLQMSQDEYEAFRFFTIGVDRGEVAGRDGLVGNAWNAQGPAVVTWREPDGLVLRIVGIGIPLEVARQVAEESRELTDAEWAELVEADDRCAEP